MPRTRPLPPARPRWLITPIAAGLLLLSLTAAACSSTPATGSSAHGTATPSGTSGTGAADGATNGTTTRETVARPAGPVADLSEEITAAGKPFMGQVTAADVPEGFVEHEYIATGTATDYSSAGPAPADGRWELKPDTTARYRTRVVVRRPADPAKFSGTAVIEWLNVSGGIDANPDYTSFADEITRKGHVWVGVSAQLIGVEGGPVLVKPPGFESIVGKGLKALLPERYGSLQHPGDGYSFDIYTQVGRAVRDGSPAVGGVKPQVVLAVGESQSAFALTSYYDGVQPLTRAFDGFFIHSRGFSSMPLVKPGEYADIAGSVTSSPTAVKLRGDLDAPVLEFQTEGDVAGLLNSFAARQPDTERFRLWEVAGGSHADARMVGPVASNLDCGVPINKAPTYFVAKAGLRALDAWVRTGQPPATAPRLETTDGDKPTVRRDADGIALGGIRTPAVDVPVEVHSGEPGPSSEVMCLLMGRTTPLSQARLAELYPSRAVYDQKLKAATDAAVKAGFVLEEDRNALLEYSDASRVGT